MRVAVGAPRRLRARAAPRGGRGGPPRAPRGKRGPGRRRASGPPTADARRALSRRFADVEGKLKEIVAEQLGVEQSSITAEASFASDLGADSLDVVEMARRGVRPFFFLSAPGRDVRRVRRS